MSVKTVAEKLRIGPESTVWLSHPERLDLIGPVPDSARTVEAPEMADVAVVFADNAASVRGIICEHEGQPVSHDTVWVAYPKGNRTDINRDTLWPILGEYGMRPTSQVSVNVVWSALRFRPLREGEKPFAPRG